MSDTRARFEAWIDKGCGCEMVLGTCGDTDGYTQRPALCARCQTIKSKFQAATDEAIERAVEMFKVVRDDKQKTWWVEAYIDGTTYRIAEEPDNEDGENKYCAVILLNQITHALRALKGE